MIRQTRAARDQVAALRDYFIERKRYEAAENLINAYAAAADLIEDNSAAGKPHPTPYPKMARFGFLWIKVHRYWIGYSMSKGYPVITNVLFDTSRMWRRVATDEDDEVPL